MERRDFFPHGPAFPIENGKALVDGVRWPLDLSAVKTLSHDLANEVRKYRLHGEPEKADLLQLSVLRLDATATVLGGGSSTALPAA